MKIDSNIRKTLEATGLPWSLDQGRGHRKIRLGGRLVGVMSSTPSPNPRATKNTITQIRRVAADIKGESQ